MTTLSLKEKFLRAASSLKDEGNSEDVAALLHRTAWVRILLEHDQQESDSFFIEVEMSLPESGKSNEFDSSQLIDRLSEHVEYLKKLRDAGFEISAIGTGCIYCASKELHETPQDNLFEVLLPPMTE